MHGLASPVASFIIVVLVGVAAGWLALRYLRGSWLSNKVAGLRRALLTSALVGIAGSFIGYHLALILAPSTRLSLMPFVVAALGAAAVLWAWQTVKL